MMTLGGAADDGTRGVRATSMVVAEDVEVKRIDDAKRAATKVVAPENLDCLFLGVDILIPKLKLRFA
jgi:hypothetical protein